MSTAAPMDPPWFTLLKWNADGLMPAIVQDAETGEVLMMAWVNLEALRLTLATGQTHFYSRSRRALWRKGDTSGHVQHVAEIRLDCDADVLLINARQEGAACHEGYHSCFFRSVGQGPEPTIIGERLVDPEKVYGKKPSKDAVG